MRKSEADANRKEKERDKQKAADATTHGYTDNACTERARTEGNSGGGGSKVASIARPRLEREGRCRVSSNIARAPEGGEILFIMAPVKHAFNLSNYTLNGLL